MTDFFDNQKYMSDNEVFLTIYAQFDECGEWGGSEEIIEILHKRDSGFYYNYQKHSADCDSLVNLLYNGIIPYAAPFKELVTEKQTKLSIFDQAAINKFAHELIDEKFNESFPGHAGVVLSLTTSDSTLVISTFGGFAESYTKLKNKLGVE